MSERRNLAGDAGRWSARHRRTAIAGWPAFVIGAYLIGGTVGQHHLTDAQAGNGQSARAEDRSARVP